MAAIQITDAISGKPRTWEEAFEEIMLGTLRGAISGAMFYYLAPTSLAGYVGTGMLDGAVGSLVEQSILGEGINIEQMFGEAILEGFLKNPNLSDIDRTLLQEGLEKTNSYITRIQDLFEPYGGID